jgi:ABC-2 type transport system permease protein
MIKTLFFVNLRGLGANFSRSGRKAGVGKKIFLGIVAVYVIAAFFLMFLVLFSSVIEPFFSAGIGWMYFAILALLETGLCVISTIFTASAQLFGARDNELLLAMPIKPSAILISRLLVILTFEYGFALLVSLPAFLLWLSHGYATAPGIVFFITGFVLLPLLAMSIALLLAWLLGVITSRLRHKNIFTLALSVGFLLAYFYFYANIQTYIADLVTRGAELAQAFRRGLPPFYAYGRGVAEGDVIRWLLFVLWAALPFTVAVFLLSINYRKVLTTNRGSVKTVYREKKTKAAGGLSALVRKNLAHYWSKPNVVLNSSIGSLFFLVAAVFVIVKRTDILTYVSMLSPALGNLPPVVLAAVVLVFLNSTNNLSSSLISLEGRNLWITKSIPVAPGKVILSKLCTHLLISGLPCLVASISAAAVLAVTPLDWLIVILLPQASGALIATGGLVINLHFPKFDWTNEVYVVKQSLSAMITVFGSMVMVIVIGVLYIFLLSAVIPVTAFLWLCTLLFAVIAAILYAWLLKAGEKKFAEL